MLTNLSCGNLSTFEACEASLVATQLDARSGANLIGARLVAAYRHW